MARVLTGRFDFDHAFARRLGWAHIMQSTSRSTVVAIALCVCAVSMTAAGIAAYVGLHSVNAKHLATYHNAEQSIRITRQRQLLYRACEEVRQLALDRSNWHDSRHFDDVAQLIDQSNINWQAALAQKDDGDSPELLEGVKQTREGLINAFIMPALRAMKAADSEALSRAFLTMRVRSEAFSDATTRLEDHQNEQDGTWYEAGTQVTSIAQIFSLLSVGTGIGVLLLVWILFRDVQYRSTHDVLTGLLNRAEFFRLLRRRMNGSPTVGIIDAVALIDLDNFKIVNDAGGHAFGDSVLCRAAKAIEACIGEHCWLARIGGDEFGLLMHGHSLARAVAICADICKSVSELQIEIYGQRVRIGASIGLASLTQEWKDAESAVQAVDAASYVAKHEGRGRVHVVSEGDAAIESLRDDMRRVREIEHALEDSRFELHWQEISPLRCSAEAVRIEILLRLIQSDGTRIGPAMLMPSAERFHVASRIDRWVVTHTFEWFAARPKILAHVESISINLSGQSTADPQFLEFMMQLIGRHASLATKLCLEITETAAIADFDSAAAFIKTLKSAGVRFALDDFGSGMSSFAYLNRLDIDYIKIDGQFVRDIETDLVDQATVRYIHEIAHVTGRQTVAEFVENATTLDLLRDFGIDYVQGFYFHRPEHLDTLMRRIGDNLDIGSCHTGTPLHRVERPCAPGIEVS